MANEPPANERQPTWVVDVDRLPSAVIELTADGHAVHATPAFEDLTGIDAQRWPGAGWLAALPIDQRAPLFAALSARADFDLELRLLRADGVKAWVRCSGCWQPASGAALCVLNDHTATVVAMQEAQADRQRLRMMADNVPVLIAYYQSMDMTCVYANRQYAQTFGLDAQSILGKTFAQVIGDEAARLIQPQVDMVLQQSRTVSYVRQLQDPAGAPRWIEVTLVPHQLGGAGVAGAFVLISDITRHRQAEMAVRESEERLSKFMDASVEGIAFHKDGYITDVNAPIAGMVGLSPEQMRGRFVLDFVAPDHLARVRRGLGEGSEQPYEAAILDREGQPVPVEFIVRRTRRAGEELRLVVVRDIRDRQAARERIRYLALHDALTGLNNRGAFMDALQASLAEHRAQGRMLALLFFDLDHFKRINDALGHLAGDAVLRGIAERLGRMLPAGAVAGRFGGDEFVVLLPMIEGPREVRQVVEQVRHAVSVPIDHDGRAIAVTPTIGVSIFPQDGSEADDLLRRADAALYAGKAQGRDAIMFFRTGMGAVVDAGLQLESQIQQALSNGEFELLWQPRLRCSDGGLAAMQAMVRWNHPQRGTLPPSAFAGAAEHRHLLEPLARWALRQALATRRDWTDAGAPASVIALDLGVLHPHGMALSATVAHVLSGEPVEPGALLIELSEPALFAGTAVVPTWLRQLGDLGARVTIDEFGAEGLSLTRLRHLPVSGLKLDRALVGGLPADAAAAAVVRAVLVLARGLGLTVCASGVESGAQQQWLAEAGCDQVQGAWVSVPMSAAQAGEWLARRSGA